MDIDFIKKIYFGHIYKKSAQTDVDVHYILWCLHSIVVDTIHLNSEFCIVYQNEWPNIKCYSYDKGVGDDGVAPLQCDVDSWDYKTPDAAEEAAVVFACRWCIHPQASLKLRPWSCPRSVWAPWWTLGTTTLGTLSLSDTVGLIETKECAGRSRVFFSLA